MGTGLVILPSGVLSGATAPSNKLNVAMIGVWGRAMAHFSAIGKENVVALCDVNEDHLALAAKEFPGAKHYVDWRKCLEQKDIDAIICSTTDHTHAPACVWAMNRGLSVYCEKPLAHCSHEARVMQEKYLENRGKLATQMGTQIHATDNYRRIVELVQSGAIGPVREVLGKLPMFGSLADQVDDQELTKVESMIQSMTRAERSDPGLIDKSRARRIARGCGRTPSDIEGLVERFMQMRQMMGMLGKQGGLLSGLGGGGGMPAMGGPGGMMPPGGFDPSMMGAAGGLGLGGGRGATKKKHDSRAKKNKRKQQRASRKKKRKK